MPKTSFALKSEAFAREGSISAAAIRRNMGRSSLDPVSLLVREAVQNSWDARVDRTNGHVGFSLHLRTLGRTSADALRNTVFKRIPDNHPIKGHLTAETGLLCLRDVGTFGLNGPVFHVPRRNAADDLSRNFIRFVRDIGRGASQTLGGGTYGFGKSTFYVASEAATVLVYTRCRSEAGAAVEDRLIACSLWLPTDDERHTGRHWWGVRRSEGIAPLTGEKAAELAETLGLPRFRRGETGTVLGILAPRFVAPYVSIDHDAARMLAETLTTWFWPRMLPGPGGDPWIDFRVYYEGREVAVPRPQDIEPFRTMCSLVTPTQKPAAGVQLHEVSSEKPKAKLGRLTLAPMTGEARPAAWKSLAIDGHVVSDLVDRPGGFVSRCHHIALMRSTWQVIRYLPCRPVKAGGHGFAGVFLVDSDEDVEGAFAQSEPPAHDDWVPDSLESEWHRRYVRIAMRRVRELGDEMSLSIDAASAVGRGPDLSRLSQILGRHLPSMHVTRRRGAGGSERPHQPAEDHGVSLVDQGSLGMLDGRRVLTITFSVTGVIPKHGLVVTAAPRVLLVGGATEHDSDTEADRPTLIGWRRSDGRLVRQDRLRVGPGDPSEWQAIVSVPDEALVGVSLSTSNGARQ